jgi:hypothetical protein
MNHFRSSTFALCLLAAGLAQADDTIVAKYLAKVTGYYFDNCNPAVPNEHMQNDDLVAKLWEVSEDLTTNYLP